MFSIMTKSFISLLEHEIANHEDEIRDFLLKELKSAAHLIMEFIESKNNDEDSSSSTSCNLLNMGKEDE